jgi:hypothetical protein
MPGHLHRLALCLVLASVFARVGEAQVLRDITLNGTDRMKISLRADARVKTSVLVNGTLEIDDTGGLSYRNTAGFELAGTIDTSGKQPVISLDETLLENEIMEAIVQVLPGTVVTSVELGKTRVRIAAKDRKGAITAKLGLGVGFTATALQGELQGKLVMGAKLSEAPLCTACGKLFEGTDSIDRSFEACDGFSVSGSGAATLEILPDGDGHAHTAGQDDRMPARWPQQGHPCGVARCGSFRGVQDAGRRRDRGRDLLGKARREWHQHLLRLRSGVRRRWAW